MIDCQWRLEQTSPWTEAAYGGLTLDLSKAFNLIGRCPAAQQVLHCGLPLDWVHFQQTSIISMYRVWEIHGSISTPFQPTTGCPEVDTWSVLAMLALQCLGAPFAGFDRTVAPLCYADNLGWSAICPDAHEPALEITQAWAEALRLQIDWKKTWVWVSNTAHAHSWRRLRTAHPNLLDVIRAPVIVSLPSVSFVSGLLSPFVSGLVSLLVGHCVRLVSLLVSLLSPFVSGLVSLLVGVLPAVSFCLPSVSLLVWETQQPRAGRQMYIKERSSELGDKPWHRLLIICLAQTMERPIQQT